MLSKTNNKIFSHKIVTKVNEMEQRYQHVMENLVMRYLMSRQKNEDKQEVTEDDINEIKGDISAFRFELLDILKNNGMQIPKLTPTNISSKKSKRKGSKKSLCRFSRQLTSDSSQYIDSEISHDNTSKTNSSIKNTEPFALSSDILPISSPSTDSHIENILSPPKRGYKPRKSFSLDEQPSVSFDLKPKFIETCHSSVKEKNEHSMKKISLTKSVLKSALNRSQKMSLETPTKHSKFFFEAVKILPNNNNDDQSSSKEHGFNSISQLTTLLSSKVNKPSKRIDFV